MNSKSPNSWKIFTWIVHFYFKVFIKEFHINGVTKDFTPFWIDQDGNLENDPYTVDCSSSSTITHPHAYSDVTIHNGQLQSRTCIQKQPLFSDWGAFSACSKSCGGGEQSRTRHCEGGICSLATQEDLIQTQPCNIQDCCANMLRITSSADSSLCSGNENEDASDWAGGEIQVSST